MTTIRVHPPVETPAGLIVALPPCDGSYECPTAVHIEGCYRSTVSSNGLAPPDVFALAVPCPNNDYHQEMHGCKRCRGTDWMHHGDYRVLEVLPIVAGLGRLDDPMPRLCVVTDAGERNGVYLLRPFVYPSPRIDLPGAVPGGVALIVERANP
jgi:hypothetical protein